MEKVRLYFAYEHYMKNMHFDYKTMMLFNFGYRGH